jgi:hypothetical protein
MIGSLATCELCGRDKPLTFHHLIPKSMHRKPRFQKRYDKDFLRSEGLMICGLCHTGIHDLISARELAEIFPSKDALLAHPPLVKHIGWVKKQK